jgi:hypothetical protein
MRRPAQVMSGPPMAQLRKQFSTISYLVLCCDEVSLCRVYRVGRLSLFCRPLERRGRRSRVQERVLPDGVGPARVQTLDHGQLLRNPVRLPQALDVRDVAAKGPEEEKRGNALLNKSGNFKLVTS